MITEFDIIYHYDEPYIFSFCSFTVFFCVHNIFHTEHAIRRVSKSLYSVPKSTNMHVFLSSFKNTMCRVLEHVDVAQDVKHLDIGKSKTCKYNIKNIQCSYKLNTYFLCQIIYTYEAHSECKNCFDVPPHQCCDGRYANAR